MMTRVMGTVLALSVAAVAASRPEMLVSTDWLAKNLADANLIVLHVAANRTAYDAGHIPGARFVALGQLAITVNGIPNELPPVADLKRILEAAGVSDETRVIVYSPRRAHTSRWIIWATGITPRCSTEASKSGARKDAS